jgi:uncharacterized protein
MDRYDLRSASAFRTAADVPAERVTTFLQKVYGWMFVGLAITACVAFAVASSDTLLRYVLSNPFLYIGLIIAELGLVFYLSAKVETLAPNVATTLFIVYSALNGVTLSFVLLVYTGESIATTFFVTAGMFGALALYGSTTTRSLAGVGQFFFMGLIGLLLASIVGMFWHNDTLQFLIAAIGVIVFTGLTAWDAQRLKLMAATVPEDRSSAYAVVGALALYLNFINLFLMLLRLLGGRRD